MPGSFDLYVNEWTRAVFIGEIRHGIFSYSFSLLPAIILYAFLVSALMLGHCQNDDVDETGRRISNWCHSSREILLLSTPTDSALCAFF